MRSASRPSAFRWLSTIITGVAVLISGGCRVHRKQPWENVPLPPGTTEVSRLPSGPGFDLERVRFHSRETGEPRFFLVLRPRGTKPNDAWILNHGWADRPEVLLEEMRIEAAYERLLREGRVRPGLVVIPDVRFANFFRVNAGRYPFPQYLALVAEEVAGLVSERYGIPLERERWGIGGFSFGGYLSLDVGRRYMGRFGRVSVISSFYDPDWTFWPATAPPAGRVDERGRGKQTVVFPGPAPQLLLACGEQDRFYREMVSLRDEFTRLGIEHTWSQAPGGHTWEYWRSILDAMFVFHLPPCTDARATVARAGEAACATVSSSNGASPR